MLCVNEFHFLLDRLSLFAIIGAKVQKISGTDKKIIAKVYVAFFTVQPLGMPLTPVVHDVMLAALVNVPLEATPLNQDIVELLSEVARHLIEFRLVQPANIPL